MTEVRRIKGLKATQKTLRASLNGQVAFVIDYNRETQSNEVEVRFKHLEALWPKVEQIQAQLDTYDHDGYDENLTTYAEMEQLYYRAYSVLSSEVKLQAKQVPETLNSTTAAPHMRLPKISLPAFDGKYENWLNFHDLFVSMVHSAPGLSNIQRFQYLRASLSNTALQLIQGISISESNYTIAWELILKHFNDSKRLKSRYVEQLFDSTALKRESATELRTLVETFETNVKVLKQLGEPTDHWDTLLVYMLSRSLDPKTRRNWEEHITADAKSSMSELVKFIQRRALVLESVSPKAAAEVPAIKKNNLRSLASKTATNPYTKCASCDGDHPIYSCVQFSHLSAAEKDSIVRNAQLCRNCLRACHPSRDCKSSSNCRKCNGRHHTLLCISSIAVSGQPRPTFASRNTNPPPSSSNASGVELISCTSTGQAHETVLLATAVIILVDDNGHEHIGRALSDSGSECCFITESFAQRMRVRREKTYLPISGIGQAVTDAKQNLRATLRSCVGQYSIATEFLILPKVTINLPTARIDCSSWNIPPNLHLTDPTFYTSSHIDVLIGAGVFFDLFKLPGRIPLGNNLPSLINSELGWVVSGQSSNSATPHRIIPLP